MSTMYSPTRAGPGPGAGAGAGAEAGAGAATGTGTAAAAAAAAAATGTGSAAGPRAAPSPSLSPSPANGLAQTASGSAPVASSASLQQSQHKRVYQACIPCRRRKVKCDLGSVDNPGDPPCVRCRRESKECYFSATRRKRKADEGAPDSLDGYEHNDDYIVRNGRKMAGSGTPPPAARQNSMGAPSSARSTHFEHASPVLPGPPRTPGGSVGRAQPLRRPNQSAAEERQERADDASHQLENLEAQQLMREKLYGPHDALDLLYKAATVPTGTDRPGQTGDYREHGHEQSPILRHPMPTPRLPDRQQHRASQSHGHQGRPPTSQSRRPPDAAIDPQLSSEQMKPPHRTVQEEHDYRSAVKAWARFRFVRAGWFTPSEAIAYIDYYFEYLSPLTPISPPTFRPHGKHEQLLTEEPILAVTLLTIATRYKKMAGAGGVCRSFAIHDTLWNYLRGMIERCLWGQEAFGGGFCGSGADISDAHTSSTAPWRGLRKGSLRTLGTVESLMILTEWHPRALHFPPAEATDELMLPGSLDPTDTDDESDNLTTGPGGVGPKRIDSWLEPAWRSDRMCWMLLSTAMGLSYELGVFDDIDELLADGVEMARPEYEEESYRDRAVRIKRLILIYVTQLAGRLGWTNMVPANLRDSVAAFAPRKRRSSTSVSEASTPTTVAHAFHYIPDLELDDQIIYCWAGISNAMRIANERLFRTRPHTTKIIQNGSYIELLKEFQPMLKNWQHEFNHFIRLPQYIKHILKIEFEYVRIYVNSLSLQAVVERCTTHVANQSNGGSGLHGGPKTNGLSPQTQSFYDKVPLARFGQFGEEDQIYVKEVVDGSRSLLRTVVEGLLPGGYLKHAPVRTYFRIISGAMFLLKTFALGASKKDVEISMALMDAAVEALRTCVVDDVHLGIRFADLLDSLTGRLRNRFMPASRAPVDASSRARTPTHVQEPEQKRRRLELGGSIQDWNNATSTYNSSAPLDGQHVPAPAFNVNSSAFYPEASYNQAADPYGVHMDVFASGDWSGIGGHEMLYVPPGAAFYQNVNDQGVTQTAEGVNVGGVDLLDYMMFDNVHVDSSGF